MTSQQRRRAEWKRDHPFLPYNEASRYWLYLLIFCAVVGFTIKFALIIGIVLGVILLLFVLVIVYALVAGGHARRAAGANEPPPQPTDTWGRPL